MMPEGRSHEGMERLLLDSIDDGSLRIAQDRDGVVYATQSAVMAWAKANGISIPPALAALMEKPVVQAPIQTEVAAHQGPLTQLPLSERAETTYLNIIGGLLSLLLNKSSPAKTPLFGNQTAVIQALIERYPNTPGISERTLAEKFAKAKQGLK